MGQTSNSDITKYYVKIFYKIKPLIPRWLQLFIRKRLVKANLGKYKNVWPILPGSEKKPACFTNWPNEKKFALVITHDVEHQKGYDRVLELMSLEQQMGFNSAFYFVPERDYLVEKKMLQTLRENGFEYGVQGLRHDGNYFSSEENFINRAKKINFYLKDWGAVGFRTPAMQHNLDLIGELDILYDLSTFDTDPFEPQPDGVGTIFPFFVPNKRHKEGGYIEMPYTLPQDFTTFILLEEKTPKIWIEKLDWIVENNGMVLLNLHPDYMQFDESKKGPETYSKSIYSSFLSYILKNYQGSYWNCAPIDLAQFWLKNCVFNL